MSDQVSKAKTLIETATETFVEEVMPSLPAEQRYTAAMTANAFSIAQRRLASPDPDAVLLDALGAGTLEALASAMRKGEPADMPEEQLRRHLLAYIEAELSITNPRFLDKRTG